jgi:hypothetical protein
MRFLCSAFFLFVFSFQSNQLFAAKQKTTIDQKCLNIHHVYLKEAYQLTKNCVGFSAPISARAYSYFSIGMHESTVEILPEMQSLSGQLNGYKRTVWASNKKDYHWSLVVNSANKEILAYLYRGMPPSNALKLQAIYDSIFKQESTYCSVKKSQKSVNYGVQIALEIIAWSILDSADNGFNENYPESYQPPQCISCWTKTTPGYLPSLLPFWGGNKTMLAGSHALVHECKPFEFSKDSTSMIYQNSKEIVELSNSSNPELEIIAEYWNDAAGYSGTPAGHWFTIAQQIAQQNHLTIERALELYAKLGIALNEASITCWKLKYTYNFLRPISYIHRFIDPQFNTIIDSPPFPEFPSGHSFQSGAGSEVFNAIIGTNYSFTDSTNATKRGIDNTLRSYTNFDEMADEISLSRLYGGIHYRYTLDQSLEYGRKLGIYVSQQIKCRK